MTTRETIWDLVADLLPQELVEQALPLRYEGIRKWEDEIKDIVDAVEALAMSIERNEEELYAYEAERLRGEE